MSESATTVAPASTSQEQRAPSGRRGGGHLYLRGRTYWMKFYVAGRPVYESTHQTKETLAQRVLNTRLGKVALGELVLPRLDRITYDEAAKDLRDYYTSSGKRNLDEAEFRLTHLDTFFRHYRLTAIGPADITRYVVRRQEAKASNGTINRELGVLGRLLRLAYKNGKLLRLPVVEKLKEAAPRQGFFERERFLAVRRHIAGDLQAAVTISYTYGWRMQSEVLTLERRQLDLEAGTLRLEPGTTKNDDGRLVYLTTELKTILQVQLERVDTLQRKLGRIVPYLFPFLSGRQRAGKRRTDFRKAWATACKKAGVPAMLRHDLRRTAVRNLERASVPRSQAMKITGHRTESVYRRYAIVSEADVREAVQKLDGYIHGDSRGGSLDARPVSM